VEAKFNDVFTMAKKTCKWCGDEYDPYKSGASNTSRYCGKKCESEAKAKGK
jgi:hypothetical protein